MKTEQIDVPHFEGFECIGLAIPKGKEHYVLSPDGKSLLQMYNTCVHLCYKKIPPKTMTLMYIPNSIAQEGDYMESFDGDLYKVNHIGMQYNKLWRPI